MAAIRHQYRDGFNGERLTLCGAPGTLWEADAIPCEDCEREKKARAEARAARAAKQIESQQSKMDQFGDPQIHD